MSNLNYELKIGDFSGPIHKLLELIELKKLEINRISLAEITADFLKYLEELSLEQKNEENNEAYLKILSDFVVIASRLIFIKSKSLIDIKDEDVEEEILDLEERIKWWQEFKPALKNVKNIWLKNYIFTQSYLPHKKLTADFFSPGNLNIDLIKLSLNNLFSEVKHFIEEQKIIKTKFVSLDKKIKSLINLFNLIEETTFSNILENSSREEIIVAFLAILHLSHDKFILIEQKEYFSDIILRKIKKHE
jgi:segregation and condensation protein A